MRDTDPQKMNVADWPEATQADYEMAEVRAQDARQHFLAELSRGPRPIADAYLAWQEAERSAFEARRARRASEVANG